MADVRLMTLGEVVDYCIDYNERQKEAEREQNEQENKPKYRKATPADIAAYFG